MHLDDFKNLIRTKLVSNDETSRHELITILQDGVLRELIENILSNKTDLLEIANQSYEHANGFIKIVLFDERPKAMIRIHLWPEGKDINSDIHNHPWDFSGVVISGEYTWAIFDDSGNLGTSFHMYNCVYSDDYRGHIFENLEEKKLRKVLDFDLKKGARYNSDGKLFHSVFNKSDDLAITLMVCGDSHSKEAQVAANTIKQSATSFRNDSMSKYNLIRILQIILEKI